MEHTERSEEDVAERLLEKLRRFIRDDLDERERAVMAVLVAPAIARANGTPDLTDTSPGKWDPAPLPDHLLRAMSAAAIRIDVAP